MNTNERNEKIKHYHYEQQDILHVKGADYTGGSLSIDCSHDVKEIERRIQGAPLDHVTLRFIFLCKHIISLETYIRTRKLESESLGSRCNDICNYINILRAEIEELEKMKEVTSD